MNNEREFHFCYTSPNAIDQLCYLIKLLNNKGRFVLNSVFYSLENIATKSLDALTEVKQQQKNGESADNEENSVYVSYNWEAESELIVKDFCYALNTKKIPYKQDKRDCKYLDNIKKFMDTIRAGKKVIVVLSRPYLKSINCMYELTGVMEDPEFKNRLLPIVVDDTIRESRFYLELVKFWKDKKEEQENIVKDLIGIDPNMVEPEQKKLKEIDTIYRLLEVIKEYIDWTNAESLDSLRCTQFKSIIDRI